MCPESSGALKRVLGEDLYVVSEKDVCIHCCLHWSCKIQTKIRDMNIIMCIIVSYPGSAHTLSLQYETGFVCKCDSIEMRTCA